MVEKRTTGYLFQDVGIFLLLGTILASTLVVANVSEGLFMESMVMMLAIFIAMLFAAFKMSSLAIITAGFQVLAYSVYKLFMSYAYGASIEWICYAWIILPIAGVGSMIMFVSGSHRTETENDILKEQVNELVMVNALTGLYNLRSLYNDMTKQISYTERNHLPLSLMIIKLKYEPELRKVLSRSHYEALIQKLSVLVTDAVRIEDRIYSIDNNGSVAVLLTCDKKGTEFVVRRIKAAVSDKDAFAGITEEAIKVDVKVATMQYVKEEFGEDVILFKQKVENELQYDV
ncbi:MAG TPA: GGDEF domain-containing protein [Lachnospiraceae bacterium]|nr:GGDEF domain-containing protein [Lachnospiraceae bacterium]